MHLLDGPRFKITRAESHVDALDSMMGSLWKPTKYHIVKAERNPRTGNDVYRVRTSMPPILLDWGIVIGEIAHNLRSALDGLVYQLALLKTKTPTGDIRQQFPIFLVGRSIRPESRSLPHQFEFPMNTKGKVVERRGDGRSMIHSLSPPHQTLIERLQPYKRGRGGEANPLFQLKEINNMDKHRLVPAGAPLWGAGPAVAGWGEEFTYAFKPYRGRFHGRMLVDGAKFGEAAPGVHVSQDIYPLISFGEEVPTVQGLPVTRTLRRIAEEVSGIIETFAPEFN